MADEQERIETQDAYQLDEQIGFLLRRANQRHIGIFNEIMLDGLTAQQFSVLMRVKEFEPVSQNELGRHAAMDQATINGVVLRLRDRGLLERTRSEDDQRRLLLSLTADGRALIAKAAPLAEEITRRTCEPLTKTETKTLIRLISKIA